VIELRPIVGGDEDDLPWAQVRDFFIEPDQRCRGLGRAFAQAIVARLREEGIGQIDLNVREDDPRALALWRSCGFGLELYRLRMYL
jgi:ribosomal protein S18 acetylase RimI-like enzyme